MSNLFNKSANGRFDILNEDNIKKKEDKSKHQKKDFQETKQKQEEQSNQEDKPRFNSFKNESPQPPPTYYEEKRNNRQFQEKRYGYKDKEQEEKNKRLEQIKKEKEKEREREESLKETNFPDLIQVKPTQNLIQSPPNTNFLDKLKQNINTNKSKPVPKNIIKPGWVCAEKDPKSNKIIYTYGEQTYFEREPEPIDVLNALVKLHETYIIQYDSLWGEGAYDEHYRSPYYDYEYFDRLDEEYEDDMKRYMEEQEQNKIDEYESY